MARNCASSRAKWRTALRVVRKAARLDGLGTEIRGREPWGELAGEGAHRPDRLRIGIDAVDLEPLAQQEDEVPAAATPGVEHGHPRADPPSEELVEEVDVDRAEEGWKVDHGGLNPCPKSAGHTA
jgi:hypothetical protein